jgi:plastocyanin
MPTPTGRRAARFSGVAAAALCAVALGGCGSSSSTTATSPASSSMSDMSTSPSSTSGSSTDSSMKSMIMIQNFAFATPTSVKAGSTVQVMNMDSETHSVTADSGGAFNVTVQPGKTVTFTAPSKPGSYPFHCSFHSNMHGSLRVS